MASEAQLGISPTLTGQASLSTLVTSVQKVPQGSMGPPTPGPLYLLGSSTPRFLHFMWLQLILQLLFGKATGCFCTVSWLVWLLWFQVGAGHTERCLQFGRQTWRPSDDARGSPGALGLHPCRGWPAASPSGLPMTFSPASLGPGRCVKLCREGCWLLQGTCVIGVLKLRERLCFFPGSRLCGCWLSLLISLSFCALTAGAVLTWASQLPLTGPA